MRKKLRGRDTGASVAVPHQLGTMYLKQCESVLTLPSGEEEREAFVSYAVMKLPAVCQENVQTVVTLRTKATCIHDSGDSLLCLWQHGIK